jgi:hypothetical protein
LDRFAQGDVMSEPTNNQRAQWANTALSAFVNEVGGRDNSEAENIQDLLTDLRHLSDAHGIDIAELWDNSAEHYAEEISEGPKADVTALEDRP